MRSKLLIPAALLVMALAALCALTGCRAGNKESSAKKSSTKVKTMNGVTYYKNLRPEKYTLDSHGPVYALIPENLDRKGKKAPMILALNCTDGDPQSEIMTNGWDDLASKEGLIVVAPTYDDSATYSEVDYIVKVIKDVIDRYPVDTERIYSTGFSNGGALSVALTSRHPELLAGISAAGWMVGMEDTSGDALMPFQLLQGTKEFTEKNSSGDMMVLDDERMALRDLFAFDGIFKSSYMPDYKKTPYWGYPADKVKTFCPEYTDYEYDGSEPVKQSNVKWQVSDYYKDGYEVPFAELVLIEDAAHIPHDYHAEIAWKFLKNFKRNKAGRIEVIK